jgi:hypothetical protein
MMAWLEPGKPVVTSMAGFEPSEPVVIKVAGLPENDVPNFPASVALSRQTSSNRQPSHDGLRSPPQSAEGTNQEAPARSPPPASLFPRHYPCQQRPICPVGVNVLGRLSMPGFEVTLYGRIWVTPKELLDPPAGNEALNEHKASAKGCERPCLHSRMNSWGNSCCITETVCEQ